MAQILIRGESVYKCTVCSRKVRVLADREGIDVVQRCTITYGCRGKLTRLIGSSDVNSTPAFPTEVPGVQDWFQRRVEYTHTQPVKTKTWVIKHNLANKPVVYTYVAKQTEASPTIQSNVPAGTVWYKSASGIDKDNPFHPSEAGLYRFDGVSWIVPGDTIPIGMIGQNIYEYQVLVKPESSITIDQNTTTVTFSQAQAGTAQCVALASQNTANPKRVANVVDTTTPQLTNFGELTIATTSSAPIITITINIKSPVFSTGVNATFDAVDDITSVSSSWVGVRTIFVNGRTYTVRSFDISHLPPMPSIMTSGNIDPNNARFEFISIGVAGDVQAQIKTSKENENLILLGAAPYAAVDRVYDKIIDIANIDSFAPQTYFSKGEVYTSQTAISSPYPIIRLVD